MSATYRPADRLSERAGLDRLAAKFRHWSLFTRLTPGELQQVFKLIERTEFAAGTLVAPYGGHDTNLYVVRSGRLLVRKPSDKYVDARERIINVGEIVNEVPFLTDQTNDFIIEALDATTVYYIERARFQTLLAENPELAKKLDYPPEVKAYLDQIAQYTWLQPGEKLIKYVKKHPYVFFTSAWLTWLALIALAVLYLGFPALVAASAPVRFVSLGVFVLSFINLVWQLVDWQNDYYALTDRRIIHQERVLFFSSVKQEAQLDKIQDVTVQQPSLASTLLGIGDVIISQIGADSRIVFATISNPGAVGAAIALQQRNYKVSDISTAREKIRDEVRAAVELKDRPPDMPPPIKVKSKVYQGLRGRFKDRLQAYREFRNTVLPYQRLEEGENIIYRKHWLDLLSMAWLPSLILMVFTGVVIFAVLRTPNLGAALAGRWWLLLVPVAIGSALLIWLWYDYEDWRNDIFVLTKKSVIDIDRQPLGLSTQRRETTLDKVQTVTAVTRGFIDSFFNVGDVVIKTGATDQLIFQRVANPQDIQADINQRLDALKRSVVEAEAAKRRSEFREWFHIYDEMQGLLYDRKRRSSE